MGILTDEPAALEEYQRLFAPGSSEGPKHLRHYERPWPAPRSGACSKMIAACHPPHRHQRDWD